MFLSVLPVFIGVVLNGPLNEFFTVAIWNVVRYHIDYDIPGHRVRLEIPIGEFGVNPSVAIEFNVLITILRFALACLQDSLLEVGDIPLYANVRSVVDCRLLVKVLFINDTLTIYNSASLLKNGFFFTSPLKDFDTELRARFDFLVLFT